MTEPRNELPASDRIAWLALGFGLVVPWWLPILSPPILTFYKEWLFALALAMGGLSLGPSHGGLAFLRRHPLVLAAAGVIAVLFVQSLVMDGVWRKATQMACFAGFFIYTVALGRAMQQRRGAGSLPWLAGCLVVAALGSCVFAVLQLSHVRLPLPLVVGWAGGRVYGNVAQANQFADLLSLGCVAAVLLLVQRKLNLAATICVVVPLLGLAVFSGSRMVWAYVVVLALIAAVCLVRRPQPGMRRLAAGMLAIGCVYLALATLVSASGILESFGVESADRRQMSASGTESTAQRLWFWRAGIDAAVEHPSLGVGAGRYPGHAHELAMRVDNSPPNAADSSAHNLIIHLAAEGGVPLALFVTACLAWWLVATWRRSSRTVNGIAAIAMIGLILVHAGLENPLWYLFFLGLLGLLAGHVDDEPDADTSAEARRDSTNFLRGCSVAVLAVAVLAYVEFGRVEQTMQVVSAQARLGAPPQPSRALNADLAAIPAWSPFGDYAEAIALITALPTPDNARDLAARCERSVKIGPTEHLFARCATAFAVAGQSERADFFANSLCRIYPGSEQTLIQSLELMEPLNPIVGTIHSTCVDRVN